MRDGKLEDSHGFTISPYVELIGKDFVLSATMSKVRWGRAETDKYGDKFYVSKCGRFRIEKKHYELPTVSVAYDLFDKGVKVTEFDKLSDAKECADEIVEEES